MYRAAKFAVLSRAALVTFPALTQCYWHRFRYLGRVSVESWTTELVGRCTHYGTDKAGQTGEGTCR